MINIDLISDIKFKPNSNDLLVTSWDNSFNLLRDDKVLINFNYSNPILSTTFVDSSNFCFGCLDGHLYQYNLDTQKHKLKWSASNAVSSTSFNKAHNILLASSLDSQLALIDSRSDSPANSIKLSHKIYDIDSSDNLVVSAMADRHIAIHDLRKLDKPVQLRESSLKFMTRRVACMADDIGFVTSSIEGRVAVDYFDPSPQAQSNKYAFKSHRQSADGSDIIYPINALAFHPIYGTFATGGSDGFVNLWDANAKKRIKSYGKFKNSVQAVAFSDDGDTMAVAYSRGPEEAHPITPSDDIGVDLKKNIMNEAKPKKLQ
ncbi:hypothetical protein E3P86_01047 [Wallemia ichthyophaga]|uniref:Uncharacterized protein n=2 Tax=Wallemia ichthyophaga TaxID=245174 RepID=A0A4T0JCU2_WALIC|nr:hypothetical protein E3P86_01047 [Wallemia ichthyophaga]